MFKGGSIISKKIFKLTQGRFGLSLDFRHRKLCLGVQIELSTPKLNFITIITIVC